MLPDYERLGVFYLGRRRNPESGQDAEPFLYDSRDLTTHAVCVGMTGSGKTGLGIALLEEAALDGIPAVVIDPKGDLANLSLRFPGLTAEEFRPWVDATEAGRRNLTVDAFAAGTARTWTEGLAEWGQDAARVQRLIQSAEVAVYTPGSDAGRRVRLLATFDPPAADAGEDERRDQVMSTVASLLGLLGVNADPVRSREHILLSALLEAAWRQGAAPQLADLVAGVQHPPFDRIGVLELETFYPRSERMGLALALNGLLASPGFAAWMQGEPLDIQRLLHTASGKPRLAVFSIAHLSEPERMFFVTRLLAAVVAWMRRQPGTSSLRALLYMDEILGYFPPTANPPSKAPMLTLLKQARAYGLGVVLATQNPVDLDYKGLSNAGTWFIGRMQTDRDKQRLLDGLDSSTGMTDRARLDRLISSLGNRVFLMRNVHEDEPVLFQSRWVLSYLAGPMTLAQIRALPKPVVATPAPAPAAATVDATRAAPAAATVCGLRQWHLPAGASAWQPSLLASIRLHFVDRPRRLDVWETRTYLAPVPASGEDPAWEPAPDDHFSPDQLAEGPPRQGELQPPPATDTVRREPEWRRTAALRAYQEAVFSLRTCPGLKLTATPGMDEGAFRAAVTQAVRERRDQEVDRLRDRYGARLATARERVRRAEERIEREKGQLGHQRTQAAISFGAAILGALLGRRTFGIGTVSRASTAMRGAGRISRERQDVGRAEDGLEAATVALQELEAALEREVGELQSHLDADAFPVETAPIRPRKADIVVNPVALVWRPA